MNDHDICDRRNRSDRPGSQPGRQADSKRASESPSHAQNDTSAASGASYGFRREVDHELFAQQASNEFERLFYSHQGRRMQKWHHYLEVYDRHLSWFMTGRKARNETQPVRLLEIGVFGGGSLQMWRKYLGPEAIIFGIDINPHCREFADPDVEVRIGSQADKAFLRSVVEEMGGVDIIVDDGSHIADHQIASFDALFPQLSDSGLYICEDLHTAYMPRYKGGLRRDGTFIEFTKQMIDWLHDWYVREDDREDGRHSDTYGFATGVFGVAVYDSIVAVEKRRRDKPFHTFVGKDEKPLAWRPNATGSNKS